MVAGCGWCGSYEGESTLLDSVYEEDIVVKGREFLR
jgi:hypothetical protein